MTEESIFTTKNFQEMLEQFAKSLQATVAITQSMQSLQNEVIVHNTSIISNNTKILVLQEKVQNLLTIVQGEGVGDSLYRSIIEIDGRLKSIEKKEKQESEQRFPWRIAIWTIGAAFLTMILNVILSPLFTNLLGKVK